MRILILENDPDQRELMKNALSGDDYQIWESDKGEDAIMILREQEVDMLIADFELPTLNGIELINNVLSANLEKTPYIILNVNNENQQDAVDCLGPIPGDYILKPVTKEEIRARISIAERSIAMQKRLKNAWHDRDTYALYDTLTGVLNRQAVYEQALAETARASRDKQPLSLAMLEIKNLKEIGNSHGLEIRDQIIRYVSSATRANIRIYDLLGRWIGPKFLLVLPNTTISDAEIVVERVQQSISTIGIRLPDRSRLQLEVEIGLTGMKVDEEIPLYVLIEQANDVLKDPGGGKKKDSKQLAKNEGKKIITEEF